MSVTLEIGDQSFAKTYYQIANRLTVWPECRVDFACRGLKMGCEVAAALTINMQPDGVSIFSCRTHRVVPIKFVLAELCWILAGSGMLNTIASYNKAMAHYSDTPESNIITSAYGLRLRYQLPVLVERLKEDIYTRQACATIYSEYDCLNTHMTHMPCNVFLQFLCRPPLLDLHVTSRSSDFVTGFSIDTLHWQALLILMANELRATGVHVIPNVLHYNIASLHVYEADCAMVDAWKVEGVREHSLLYEHLVPLVGNMTLSEAITNCQKNFKADLTLPQLMDVLCMGTEHLTKMIGLDEMFRLYKNKVIR